MRTFKHVLEIDPDQRRSRYQNIGDAAARSASDHAAAEASLRRALALDPTLAGAYTTLGVVLAQHRPQGRGDRRLEARGRRSTARNSTRSTTSRSSWPRPGQRDEARIYGQRYVATAPPALYGQEIASVRRLLEGGKV